MKPVCPYCNKDAELTTGDYIYPHRKDLAEKSFYVCWPCDAYVGTHKDTAPPKPLGRLANAELRKAKQAAHAAFDPLWKHGAMKRGSAYGWLSKSLGIPKHQAHIGMFDVDQCRRVVELVANNQPT